MKTIITRLECNYTKVVKTTLQFIISLLASTESLSNCDVDIYTVLRTCNLSRNIEKVIRNQTICDSCKPLLLDLQSLLLFSVKKNRASYGSSNTRLNHEIIVTVKQELDSLTGAVKSHQSETVGRENKNTNEEEESEILDLINSVGGWSGCLDLYEMFLYDKQNLVKHYTELASTTGSKAFPLLGASIEVSRMLEKIFNVQKATLPEYLNNGTSKSFIPLNYIHRSHSGATIAGKELPPNPQSDTTSISWSMSDSLLFLNWGTLHFNGVTSFMRMWKAASACPEDIKNISAVVENLFNKVIEKDVSDIKIENLVREMNSITYQDLRLFQLTRIESTLNTHWKKDIDQLYQKYFTESERFVRDQCIYLLLSGDIFWAHNPTVNSESSSEPTSSSRVPTSSSNRNRRYFVSLAPSKKFLKYKILDGRETTESSLDIDLSTIHQIKVKQLSSPSLSQRGHNTVNLVSRFSYSRITLTDKKNPNNPVLTFYSDTIGKAKVWRDGIMMVKDPEYVSDSSRQHSEILAKRKLRLQLLTLGPRDHNITVPDFSTLDVGSDTVSTDYYYR